MAAATLPEVLSALTAKTGEIEEDFVTLYATLGTRYPDWETSGLRALAEAVLAHLSGIHDTWLTLQDQQ